MSNPFEEVQRFLASLKTSDTTDNVGVPSEPLTDHVSDNCGSSQKDPFGEILAFLGSLDKTGAVGTNELVSPPPILEEDRFADIRKFLKELDTTQSLHLQKLSDNELFGLLCDKTNPIKESDLKLILNDDFSFSKGAIRTAVIHRELKDPEYLRELFNRFAQAGRFGMLAFFARNPNLPVDILNSIYNLIKVNDLYHSSDSKPFSDLEKVKEVYLQIFCHPNVQSAIRTMVLVWVLEMASNIRTIYEESGDDGIKKLETLRMLYDFPA